MKPPVKSSWLEKAEEVFRFHRSKLLAHDNWNVEDTASALSRSIGSVSEDLKIARWYRTHKEKIESFEYAKEALKWIKEEEKKIKRGEG